ncbi:MAG: hypothetical protein JWO82_366 [Akkermansiaceae bacterium]|nr:hypothetical protein [Akkermansiaceae bacterium]
MKFRVAPAFPAFPAATTAAVALLLLALSGHPAGAAEDQAAPSTTTPAVEIPATPPDEKEGFVSIFDGTLKNWEGDPVYWRAENGVLTGEVTPETLLKQNSFIVWRGGELADFELTADYRVSAQGNSGINYRSIDVTGVKYAMEGYQDDIDGQDAWSGQNYEERGRTFLAYRGQSVVLSPGEKPQVVKELGDRAELQKKVLKEDWNHVHIVARGNRLQHFTNGVLMAEVVDNDPDKRRLSGLLGVQVHVGPPMKIEFKNIRLKKLGK